MPSGRIQQPWTRKRKRREVSASTIAGIVAAEQPEKKKLAPESSADVTECADDDVVCSSREKIQRVMRTAATSSSSRCAEQEEQRVLSTLLAGLFISSKDNNAPPQGLLAVPVPPSDDAERGGVVSTGEQPRIDPEYSLLPHQLESLEWLDRVSTEKREHGLRGGILSLEMGLGKTLTALEWVARRVRNNTSPAGPRPSLFLCNKSLLGEMQREARKFYGNTLKCLVLDAGLNPPLKFGEATLGGVVAPGTHLVIMTYDKLVALAKSAGRVQARSASAAKSCAKEGGEKARAARGFLETEFETVVADESQRFVNPCTLVFKSLRLLRSDFRICLTGTPVVNYHGDLRAQFEFCGLEVFAGGAQAAAEGDGGARRVRWNKQTFEKLGLRDHILSRSVASCDLQLPEKTITTVNIELADLERKRYSELLDQTKDALARVARRECRFSSVLTCFAKLRQACISQEAPATASSKIAKVLEIVEEVPENDKILIFSGFSTALASTMHELQKAPFLKSHQVTYLQGCQSCKKRETLLRYFKERGRVLLASYDVCAKGLNLTEANHVILLEPSWDLSDTDQAVARVWRIGQKKNVFAWKLVCANSIEQRIEESVEDKKTDYSKFLSPTVLKALLEM